MTLLVNRFWLTLLHPPSQHPTLSHRDAISGRNLDKRTGRSTCGLKDPHRRCGVRQPESGNAPGKNTLAGLVNPSSGQFLFKLPGIYFFPVQHEDFFVVVCLLACFYFLYVMQQGFLCAWQRAWQIICSMVKSPDPEVS